jgi:hypothetical protein
MVDDKFDNDIKITSVAAHFEGLANAPEQYRWHCLMRHVQGYPGSHWTPPLGNYLLCITPAATRATANKMKKWTKFAGNFDGRGLGCLFLFDRNLFWGLKNSKKKDS